jgi:hypothetical protein
MSDYGGEILRRQLAGKNGKMMERDNDLDLRRLLLLFQIPLFPIQWDSSVMEFQNCTDHGNLGSSYLWGVQNGVVVPSWSRSEWKMIIK